MPRKTILKLLFCLGLALASFAYALDGLWETANGRERIFNALVSLFRDNYWNPDHRDWDGWAADFHDQAVGAETRAAFDSALRRMVDDLGDHHSRWVGLSSPASVEAGGDSEPGLGFRHSYLSNQGIVVERVFPETPAAEARLQRGDLIVRVNGREMRNLESPLEVDRLLREAIDSGAVQIGVRRRSQLLTLNLRPAEVDFATVSDLPQGYMLDDSTGYLYIPSFKGEGVAQTVNDLLGELSRAGATSLVLDLRDNLGGRLGELGLVLGAFIEGPWVEAVSRDTVIWRSSYQRRDDQGLNVLENPEGTPFAGDSLQQPVRFSGPLAVLVSRQNSSAGEIAPLVLQSLGRATVLGEPTEGNVEAIQGFDLPDGSLVYIAVANLRSIDGRDFSTGVAPDILVSSSLQDLARGFDAPVAEALKALKSLPFTPGKLF